MTETYSMERIYEWELARRSAFVQQVLAAFTQRPTDLLPFEDVRQGLHLSTMHYLGLQDVPLDHIVGSVGRYRDFTRAFFPRQASLRDRWRRVSWLTTMGQGLPPIELYKIGQAYFVRDGNHRVSVARQNGAVTIEAYVWEYETRVPLEPDTDIGELLCKASQAAFLERTNLDRLCPGLSIEFTQPDGYDDMLYEIEAFQQTLSLIDEREVDWDEAVVLWGEMQYEPIIEIIRQREILQEFPNHTEADLYLWLRRNQEELEMRYGERVLMEDAADDLTKRFGEKPTPARQVKEAVERVAEGVGELGELLVRSITTDHRVSDDDVVAAAMLASVRRIATMTPPYRFRGATKPEWQAWRAEFRERLWDVLGAGDSPDQPYGPDELQAWVEDRVQVNGLWRELVWFNTEGDLRVPAYLFLPPQVQAPQPAIVVFPGHGTIDQTAGLDRSGSCQHTNALELASAGFVTLSVEPRGFGRLGAMGHLQIDTAARLVGRTWYGMLVQDGMRAIDYLLTRPEIDPTRIGATGIGAGGALTMYTAALDDRIRVALISGYLNKYVIASLDEEHCLCNDIPHILRYAEMGDVAALIAPRPAMFVNGRRDPASNPSARESFVIAHHVYQFLGAQRRIRLIEPEEMGHCFDNQLAIGWFRRWLVGS